MRKRTVGEHIETMIGDSFNTLNTIAIAKIINVDNLSMMAEIQLMDMPEIFGTRDEIETIENVPIAPIFWGKNCKINAPLSVGDKVIVGFCQHDTFNARNSSEPTEPNSSAKFDINNAIVLGQITSDSESNLNSNAFYVAMGGTMLTITDSGVEINGNVNINGSLTVSDDAEIGGKSFLKHTNDGKPLD